LEGYINPFNIRHRDVNKLLTPEKSKNQKKAARILLGSGAALLATGFIIPKRRI
jgi:hypothetical protein